VIAGKHGQDPPGHGNIATKHHRYRPVTDLAAPRVQNPGSTYTCAFTIIRGLVLPVCPKPQVRGYKPGRFSFNVKGGTLRRCAVGDGLIKIEECTSWPECQCHLRGIARAKRYKSQTLEVKFKGAKSIRRLFST